MPSLYMCELVLHGNVISLEEVRALPMVDLESDVESCGKESQEG